MAEPCQVLCVALPADRGAALEARLRQHLNPRPGPAPAQNPNRYPDQYPDQYSDLDCGALQRIDRLHRAEDRLRSLLGRLLLRHALRSRGVPDDGWLVELGPYGKPRLRGPAMPEFNLSHAGDWVVCAVAPTAVGIDIEQVRAIDLGIAERFFQPGEYTALLAQPADQQRDYFFRLWTAKEAYVKALGLGLQRDFSSFRVTPSAAGAARLHDPYLRAQRLALAYLPCAAGYRLALCSADPGAGAGLPPSCTTVGVDQLAP
jgi:4'-phosphopantetheinyl transferase